MKKNMFYMININFDYFRKEIKMDNENKSKYESTVKWVIEHYPFDKISNIFDITQNISDLKLPEEELGKVFDEYLKNNYELKEGKKYLKYTQDDYERIEKINLIQKKMLKNKDIQVLT